MGLVSALGWSINSPTMSKSILLVLFVALSIGLAAKVVPFVPKELTRADVDIAKLELKKLKMVETEALKMAEKEKQFVKTLVEATTEEPLIPDDNNNVVPIVVGSILVGLILVVLVSYFIVRMRRTKN